MVDKCCPFNQIAWIRIDLYNCSLLIYRITLKGSLLDSYQVNGGVFQTKCARTTDLPTYVSTFHYLKLCGTVYPC